MKKNLFILAAAAVALASCSSDDLISENAAAKGGQPQEIAFTPVSQAATRAAAKSGAIEGTEFPTDLDMMVAAYEQTGGGRDFFEATEFKYQYAGGNSGASHSWWGGSTARYWPLAPCFVNFLAITNANDDNSTDVTGGNAGSAFASKVVVIMADNYAYDTKQHDFMYAIGNGAVTQSDNTLTFPPKVDMTFKHAQAYLTFRVKAADAASQAIKIKNIEISGARFAGTATITHTNYNATSSQAATLYWNPTTTTAAYKSVLDDQTEKADEANSIALTQQFVQMGKIMVVPNMSDPDSYADNGDTKIKITYYLNSNEYNYVYTVDNDTYNAGKKYIYDITFKLNEIFINPSITDWNDVNNIGQFVDIPNYTIGSPWNYGQISKDAATYKFTVSGNNASSAFEITNQTGFTAAPTIAAGVVTFNVEKNTTASPKTYTITVKDDNGTPSEGGDDKTSVITITQAATPAP